MIGPYRWSGKRAILTGRGESPKTNPNPSSGGTGSRLKTASSTLMLMNALMYGTIDLSRMPGIYVVSRTITDAATMFDTGPASEDSAQPRLGLRIAAGLIGIGLPQPIGPIRIIRVPIGSRCFN